MKGIFDLDSAKKYNYTKQKLISKNLIIGDIKSVTIKYWRVDKAEGIVDLNPYFVDYIALIASDSCLDIAILAFKVKGLDLLVKTLKEYTNISGNAEISDPQHNINTQLLSMLFSDLPMQGKVFINTVYSMVFKDWMLGTLGLNITSFSAPRELDESSVEHDIRIVGDAIYAMYYGDDKPVSVILNLNK